MNFKSSFLLAFSLVMVTMDLQGITFKKEVINIDSEQLSEYGIDINKSSSNKCDYLEIDIPSFYDGYGFQFVLFNQENISFSAKLESQASSEKFRTFDLCISSGGKENSTIQANYGLDRQSILRVLEFSP